MTPRRGFTLLEAVLALAILSAVMATTLAIRTQSLASARKLTSDRVAVQGADELFEMAAEGLLPPPETQRGSPVRTWRGEHLGRAYLINAAPLELPSALPEDQRGSLSDRVIMYRYTLQFAGRESEFLWHR